MYFFAKKTTRNSAGQLCSLLPIGFNQLTIADLISFSGDPQYQMGRKLTATMNYKYNNDESNEEKKKDNRMKKIIKEFKSALSN